MSFVLGLALAIGQSASGPEERCADPKSERDVAVCAYLKRIEELKIRSVESVAVGTREQLLPVREQARRCDLMNRIDYVGTKVSVFDIFNADDDDKECLISWIRTNTPELEFSEERLNALVRAQHHSD